jgi:hypothetical protein
MSQTLLDFTVKENFLRISIILNDLDAVLGIIELAIDSNKSDEDKFIEAISSQTENGWNLLSNYQMEQFCMLSEAPVLTQTLLTDMYGDPINMLEYYYFNYYQIRSAWADIVNYGYVDFALMPVSEEDREIYAQDVKLVETGIDYDSIEYAAGVDDSLEGDFY